MVGDIEIRLDTLASFRDTRSHRGQLRLIPHHLFGDLDAKAHLACIDVDNAHVLVRLCARAANALAVSRVERRVEIATKGIEPRSRRLKVLDSAECLQRRQRRQLSDGQVRQRGQRVHGLTHRHCAHVNARSPVPRRSA